MDGCAEDILNRAERLRVPLEVAPPEVWNPSLSWSPVYTVCKILCCHLQGSHPSSISERDSLVSATRHKNAHASSSLRFTSAHHTA